jgi:RNA polymerase sigma factor (sigma-70 family)
MVLNLPLKQQLLSARIDSSVTMSAANAQGKTMVRTTGAISGEPDSGSADLAVELNDRFWKRLCVFAARRVRDRSAAEDVAQETLRRVLEALRDNRIEKLEALPAFVFQTARNICLHYGRSARREQGALLKFRGGMQDSSGDEEDALVCLIDEARQQEVRNAMQELNEDDRELLRLLYVEGLKSSEIATRLGVDAGTLRVRKHRALKRLAERLGNVSN